MNHNFSQLCKRAGGYSVPWLIRLHDDDNTESLYFINDTQARTYGGNTYIASTFEYTPDADDQGFNGGGTLDITVIDNTIIDILETYKSVSLDVTGVLLKDGTVTEIKEFVNQYGSVTWTAKKASFTFDRDDRLDMTFPALVFNTYNNRGLA